MESSEAPPPPYSASTSTHPQSNLTSNHPSNPPQTQTETQTHLDPSSASTSTIPPASRRSMEDESRPLPPNWIRQYDPQTHHQFYVDTSMTPHRSIWAHPFDDEVYLSGLSEGELSKIQSVHNHNSHFSQSQSQSHNPASTQEDTDSSPLSSTHKFGRKLKDRITNSTHSEREAERQRRDEEEAEAYRQHAHIRAQMSRAAQTGEPQLIGRDRNGREVYVEPPRMGGIGMGMGGGMMGAGGGRGYGYGGGGYGIDPYGSQVYGRPNAMYLRPQGPYNRPYGGGYGGGMGLPLLGGLGGGMLLGGLLF